MRMLLAAAAALIAPAAGAGPDDVQAVPVIWRAPACAYEKLGGVAIKEGREVSSRTKDVWVPSADYRYAFARLGQAAREKGGNAVVLRWHEATFFTRKGRRSPRPVFVQLRGAAIRVSGTSCALDHVDPLEIQARALRGEPFDAPPELTAPDASAN